MSALTLCKTALSGFVKVPIKWIATTMGILLSGSVAANDNLIREASHAYKRRDEARLQALIDQTRGHLLEAYPVYWLHRLRLGEVPAAQIEAFAEKYPGALAQQLRMEWLNEQAKRGHWQAWSASALTLESDNADFLCNRAHWQLREGKTPATPPPGLWAERLSDACAESFAAYARAHLVSDEDVVLRFRSAADGATLYAVRTLANALPENIRPDEAQLALAYSSAIRLLQKATATARDREVLLYAIARLARQDVELAEEVYRKLRRQWRPSDRAWAALQLGVFAARQHHPEAMRWFKQVTGTRVLDAQAQWWVRAALRAGDWPEVLRATDAMSEAGRNEPTWAYWRARALAATGQWEAAQAIFAKHKDGFGFYNWLCAEELKTQPAMPAAPPHADSPSAHATSAALIAFDRDAGAQRVVALSRLNLRFEAAREWAYLIKDFSDEQLLAASAWMQKHGVWDRAISAAVRTKHVHDVKHRYVVPYSEALYGAARLEGVEPALVAALTRQESRFAPDVVSSAGAIGLMQLMPNTARWVAKRLGWTYDRDALEDPKVNARMGTYYLRTVMEGLANSPVLGLAAYNAGPGRAKNWQAERPLEGAIYAETILFNETRDYVKQVLANVMWIDRIHKGGRGPSLKARLGTVPSRSAPMTLANDTP